MRIPLLHRNRSPALTTVRPLESAGNTVRLVDNPPPLALVLVAARFRVARRG